MHCAKHLDALLYALHVPAPVADFEPFAPRPMRYLLKYYALIYPWPFVAKASP